MPKSFHIALSLAVASLFAAPIYAQVLPEGNTGIAGRYPGDAGIASDPSVLLADGFEAYSSTSGLAATWTTVQHVSNMRLASEPGNFYSGAKGLEITIHQNSPELSVSVIKAVSPARDVLFLRYYGKYDTALDVLGSSHNGSTMSASYCCPGVKADGYNKFYVSYEAGREEASIASRGKLKVYVYHPDQRDVWGDHFYPTVVVSPFTAIPGEFGPTLVARPDVVPQLGRWYAHELMVKTNTPGQRDGHRRVA